MDWPAIYAALRSQMGKDEARLLVSEASDDGRVVIEGTVDLQKLVEDLSDGR